MRFADCVCEARRPSNGLQSWRKASDGPLNREGARLLSEEGGAWKRGLLHVEAYTYDSVKCTVQSEAARVLYWADTYHRQWRAFANDQGSPVFRANVNVKAVVVPAGRSNVRFEYVPALFEAGLWIYYASLAADRRRCGEPNVDGEANERSASRWGGG